MGTDPTTDEREIRSTRLFDVPRGLLFESFRDPGILARWWGPRGFASTFQEYDLRPGGAWRFVMRGPDGSEYPMEKRFLAVVPEELIELRHEDPRHGFRMTMTFAEEDDGTRLTWRMYFDDPAEAARVRGFVVEANEQNFDRLAAEVAART